MGAIFPVFDKEIQGIDVSSVSGRMINRYDPELGEIAQNAGFTPLMNFFGANPSEYFDEKEIEELEIPDEQIVEKWFEPEEGLRVIRFLITHLHKNPSEFENDTKELIADLENFEKVLQKAKESEAKWHVMIEI